MEKYQETVTANVDSGPTSPLKQPSEGSDGVYYECMAPGEMETEQCRSNMKQAETATTTRMYWDADTIPYNVAYYNDLLNQLSCSRVRALEVFASAATARDLCSASSSEDQPPGGNLHVDMQSVSLHGTTKMRMAMHAMGVAAQDGTCQFVIVSDQSDFLPLIYSLQGLARIVIMAGLSCNAALQERLHCADAYIQLAKVPSNQIAAAATTIHVDVHRAGPAAKVDSTISELNKVPAGVAEDSMHECSSLSSPVSQPTLCEKGFSVGEELNASITTHSLIHPLFADLENARGADTATTPDASLESDLALGCVASTSQRAGSDETLSLVSHGQERGDETQNSFDGNAEVNESHSSASSDVDQLCVALGQHLQYCSSHIFKEMRLKMKNERDSFDLSGVHGELQDYYAVDLETVLVMGLRGQRAWTVDEKVAAVGLLLACNGDMLHAQLGKLSQEAL